MLYIVVKAAVGSKDTDIQATVSSIPRRLKKNINIFAWKPSFKKSNSKELSRVLSDKNASDEDFVIIVQPGIIFNNKILNRFFNSKYFDSANRIRALGKESIKHWTGVNPVAVQYDLFSQLDFSFGQFDQDDRARYFLEALRHEWWYSSIPGDIKLPSNEKLANELGPEDQVIYTKEWYMDFQKKWNKLLKDYEVASPMAQTAYLYMLQWRIIHNINSSNKFVLLGKDLKNFYNHTKKNLSYIEDRIILQISRGSFSLDYKVRLFLLKIKNQGIKETYIYSSRNITKVFNRNQISSAAKSFITIESMDYYKDKLTIAGYTQFNFDPSESYLVCRCDDKEYELADARRYGSFSIFGKEIYRNRTFVVDIPYEVVQKTEMISFHIVSINKNTDVRMNLRFTRQMSKLNSDNKFSYWYVEKINRIIKYKGRVIWVTRGGLIRRIYHEIRYVFNLLVFGGKKARKSSLFRIVYYLTKPMYNKPIWIFYDKFYKAGDNGEYLYNYSKTKNDGIVKKYILSKKSVDVKRFKAEGKNFLSYGSIGHILSFLNSSIVFATHSNQPAQNSLISCGVYLRDLFKYKTLFIQHGLTVQEQSRILNKYVDNTKLYFVASHFETDNLLKSGYGYNSEEIKLTGVPRYDGLKSDSNKTILITPSWRSYLALPMSERRDSIRSKNNLFKDSDYYKIYNKLINDEKLLKTVVSNGYKLIYLLHPALSSQISDFDGYNSEVVEVVAASDNISYEKALTQADIMVTDYSGVQFDFAYMNKPILYYQPKELPPTYDEAVYNYTKDALGEVITSHELLVDRMCWYVKNNCSMPKEYKDKVNKFFYHRDFSNSQRIYDISIQFQNEEPEAS